SLVANLAWIYAWIGERDLAIEQLEIALGKIPATPTYGELRLNPIWDSLRGDPRFEKVVNSLAPKDSPKQIVSKYQPECRGYADLSQVGASRIRHRARATACPPSKPERREGCSTRRRTK